MRRSFPGVQDDARPEAAGTRDHAGHSPVVGLPARAEPATVADRQHGTRLHPVGILELELLRAVRADEPDVPGLAVEVDLGLTVGAEDPQIGLGARTTETGPEVEQ